jgi:hypothetical protein
MEVSRGTNHSVSVRIGEFVFPPVTDGLVLGKDSPIDFAAITRALSLLIVDHMQSIEVDDDIISHIIVRRGILRRVPQDRLVSFVLQRVKPHMSAQEILHLEIKVEVLIEDIGSGIA